MSFNTRQCSLPRATARAYWCFNAPAPHCKAKLPDRNQLSKGQGGLRESVRVSARDVHRATNLSLKNEAKQEQADMHDQLIAVFQSRKQNEWKKLIAFSKQWPSLSDGVFARINELIQVEEDPGDKLKLRRFLRGLRTASDDVAKTAKVFKQFDDADPLEYEALVAGNPSAINDAFFEHLQNVIYSEHEDPDRQEKLVKLGASVAALDEAFRKVQADDAVMDEAQAKLQTLLQVSTLEEADAKIDDMASTGQLDPALLLTMARAYCGVKETDYTSEEAKDVMHHLYTKGKEAAARDAPAEVRILKELLTIEDPRERAAQMANAMEKGPELYTPNADYLSTDPQKLMATAETVLAAYTSQKGKGSMLGQTADIMNPEVITRLGEIKDMLRKQYM